VYHDQRRCIWILATPILSVGPSISSVIYDIKDFHIECPFDIDVLLLLHLRYRTPSIFVCMSISKVFDIEGIIMRYRTSQTFDIEGHEYSMFRLFDFEHRTFDIVF
jgi:hypothetical protein